jgi:glycine/serine hydroxymethyltransferase
MFSSKVSHSINKFLHFT